MDLRPPNEGHTMNAVATKAPAAPKADIRDRLAAEMDAALGKTPKAAPKAATKAATPTPAEVDAQCALLVKQWKMADVGEAQALDVFKAAGIAWENARVIKVRVAWQAAMIKPNGKAANLLNACRILFSDPTATPKERTKAAEAKKSTLRNYVDAGTALDAESLGYATGEPTEQERKIVAQAFREGNKRDKAEADAAKGEGEGKGEGENGEGEGEGENLAVTYVDLVGHVAQMNKILAMLEAGAVPVSEREAGNMADMLNSFQMKLSAYAEGK